MPQSVSTLLTQQACDSATALIRAALSLDHIVTSTHDVTVVTGLDSPTIIEAVATYLTNCAAQTVTADIKILADLLGDSTEVLPTLHVEVERLIGSSNHIIDDFRQDHRDPWIAEALAHLLLVIAESIPPLPPPGKLHVLTPVHDYVKERGLDLVGIYTAATSNLGLAVCESKSSENNATSHVGSAGGLFCEIMEGVRDAHIRSKVQVLRASLPDEAKAAITPMFWKNECCYCVFVSMSSACGFDVNASRSSFATVNPRPILIVVSLDDYRGFFNALADQMRVFVAGS